MDREGELLSVAEAARSLNRSTEQVRRYLREGRLSGRRLGGQWFIEAAALRGFHGTLREQQHVLDRIRPANERDPLEAVIGIGQSSGNRIAEGKDAYRRAFRWRR